MWVFLTEGSYIRMTLSTQGVFLERSCETAGMMGSSWGFLGIWQAAEVSLSLLRVSRVVSGRERRHSKGQGRQCPAFSVHSKTLHTLHSPLVASCPTRAKEWRSPKEHRLTWSVSFFSRAWSRLRASSNWPPSCWLASPLIRPPAALKLRSLFRQNGETITTHPPFWAPFGLGPHCPASGHGQWRLARKLPVRSGPRRRTPPPARYNGQAVHTAHSKSGSGSRQQIQN